MVRLRPAFTLIEVLLVVLLVGLIAAIAWPDFGAFGRTRQLAESADRVKSLVSMCRAQAMNEAKRYRITVQQDGRLKVTCQRDPLTAPQDYVKVRDPWAYTAILMEDVWIDAVLPLPDGPPPILVEDDTIDFDEFTDEPFSVTELKAPLDLDFEPDGSSASARWILRDLRGRGLQMTLDGRLGRVEVLDVDPLLADDVKQPARLPEEKTKEDEEEDARIEKIRQGGRQ